MRDIIVSDENQLLSLGTQLAQHCPSTAVIYLKGPLGAGKTTLARGFLRGFGFQGHVKSPTFTLVEPYHLPTQLLYHFDLYRLKDPNELIYIGISDYFTQNVICLIEWPEKGEGLLGPPDLCCTISVDHPGRRVVLDPVNSIGNEIIHF